MIWVSAGWLGGGGTGLAAGEMALTHDGGYLGPAAVSPDGARVAYVARGDRFVKLAPGLSRMVTPLKVLDVASGRVWTVAEDGQWPSWSSDGRRIAFVRQVGAEQAVQYVADVETGRVARRGAITPLPDPFSRTFLSPDRRYALVGRGWTLWWEDGKTGETREVGREFVGSVNAAAWSPDGGRAAFATREGVWVMDAKAQEVKRVWSGYAGGVAWSRDGAWLAFDGAGVGGPGTARWQEAFVIRPDGSELRRLTMNHVGDGVVGWVGDGLLLARWEGSDRGANLILVSPDEPIPFGANDARAANVIPPEANARPERGARHEQEPADVTAARVNVFHDCPGDPLNGLRHEDVPLESYVAQVLPNEWIPSWDEAALDAGAIAARSWALAPAPRSNCLLLPDGPEGECYVNTWNCGQNFRPGSQRPQTDAAVARTAFQYLTYEAADFPLEVVNAQYRRDTGNPTESWLDAGSGYPYLAAVVEPVSEEETLGPGMSQVGSQRWASGEGLTTRWRDARQILAHYYRGVEVRGGDGQVLTPPYRWNPLQVEWAGRGEWLCPGEARELRVWVQNTGTAAWPMAGEGAVSLRYRWLDEEGMVAAEGEGAAGMPREVWPGEDVRLNLRVQAPPATGGAHVLVLDMFREAAGREEGMFFSQQQPSWPDYRIDVRLSEACALFKPMIWAGKDGRTREAP
ncbi:MAG: hypothetical protein GXP42_03195 [Chloroflexi bacterium]|nr:hypothetical protein [Chloroflexota bacterium]